MISCLQFIFVLLLAFSANGRTQLFKWDAAGRLVSVIQRENTINGFNWTAIYDALGRRIRTIETPIVNGVTNSIMALTLDSYYDPQVEFGEIGVAVNGQRTWKVTGPDIDGVFGSFQGVGGLEATVTEVNGVPTTTTPVLNDYFGNVLATISGGAAVWNSTRVGSYGAVLGYQAPMLTPSTPLAEALVWRSRRLDPTGYYWLGARYYDPMAGKFISPDPMGHEGSWDLYSFCNGDPLNKFDPTGRFGKGIAEGVEARFDQVENGVYGFLANMGFISQVTALENYESIPDPSYGSAAYQAGFSLGYNAPEQMAMLAGALLVPEVGAIEEAAGFESVGAEEFSANSTSEFVFDESGQGEFGFAQELGAAPAEVTAEGESLASTESSALTTAAEDSTSISSTGGSVENSTPASTGGSIENSAPTPTSAPVQTEFNFEGSSQSANLGGPISTSGAAEETVTLYHGTTTSAARNILNGGFRAGADNAVFFGEDFSTARFFGESRIAETGANSGQVLRYTMPQSLAEDLGLTSRQVLGEFRGAPPIDIPGGSGFERIMTGGNIDAFNQAVKAGQISVKPIRIGY